LPFLFAFRHGSGYARRTSHIYTLKYMKNSQPQEAVQFIIDNELTRKTSDVIG
jgi:hypothetical protein